MKYGNEGLLSTVKESKKPVAKRVNIINVKVVKESSFLYDNRYVRSPEDSCDIFREYLEGVDREHFVVAALLK